MRSLNRHFFPFPVGIPHSRLGGLSPGLPPVPAIWAVVSIALWCLPADVVAQPTRTDVELTVPPGVVLGVGAGIGVHGFAALVSLGVPLPRGELMLRGGVTTETDILADNEGVADLGVLYGVRRFGNWGWIRFAGGLGYVGSYDDVGRDVEYRDGVGLLGQLDVVRPFHSHFGVGISFFGAVGSWGAAYGAVGLGLFIGRGGG